MWEILIILFGFCQVLLYFLTYDDSLQPGYHLKRTGPYSFSCQKLGQISVLIHSKDDAKIPIPSVLLSLSGDDGYRNNSISSARGDFIFGNLFPGSFYLRPLLKVHCYSRLWEHRGSFTILILLA